MAAGMEHDEIPTELQDRLGEFDEALANIEQMFEPLHKHPLNELHTKMNALEKAKLDLVGVYAVNSLFWMYLNVTGENPKTHGIKSELNRIQGYMTRVKELEDRKKMVRLDKDASKRFIRSALWQQAQQKKTPDHASPGQATLSTPPESSKRPASSQQSDKEAPQKKQKGNKNKMRKK